MYTEGLCSGVWFDALVLETSSQVLSTLEWRNGRRPRLRTWCPFVDVGVRISSRALRASGAVPYQAHNLEKAVVRFPVPATGEIQVLCSPACGC